MNVGMERSPDNTKRNSILYEWSSTKTGWHVVKFRAHGLATFVCTRTVWGTKARIVCWLKRSCSLYVIKENGTLWNSDATKRRMSYICPDARTEVGKNLTCVISSGRIDWWSTDKLPFLPCPEQATCRVNHICYYRFFFAKKCTWNIPCTQSSRNKNLLEQNWQCSPLTSS
jgi:hypothetical protein